MHPFQLKQSNTDLLIMTISTVLAVLFGNATVYYIVYVFWWNELINQVVGRIFAKKQTQPIVQASTQAFGPFFLLFIYFFFINIFFGLIANYSNEDYVFQNLQVLFFKNWYFNSYILFTIAENIYLYRKGKKKLDTTALFSANLIVLHISIILGAMVIAVLTAKFNGFFDHEQALKTLLIVSPFLLIRYLAYRFFGDSE